MKTHRTRRRARNTSARLPTKRTAAGSPRPKGVLIIATAIALRRPTPPKLHSTPAQPTTTQHSTTHSPRATPRFGGALGGTEGRRSVRGEVGREETGSGRGGPGRGVGARGATVPGTGDGSQDGHGRRISRRARGLITAPRHSMPHAGPRFSPPPPPGPPPHQKSH